MNCTRLGSCITLLAFAVPLSTITAQDALIVESPLYSSYKAGDEYDTTAFESAVLTGGITRIAVPFDVCAVLDYGSSTGVRIAAAAATNVATTMQIQLWTGPGTGSLLFTSGSIALATLPSDYSVSFSGATLTNNTRYWLVASLLTGAGLKWYLNNSGITDTVSRYSSTSSNWTAFPGTTTPVLRVYGVPANPDNVRESYSTYTSPPNGGTAELLVEVVCPNQPSGLFSIPVSADIPPNSTPAQVCSILAAAINACGCGCFGTCNLTPPGATSFVADCCGSILRVRNLTQGLICGPQRPFVCVDHVEFVTKYYGKKELDAVGGLLAMDLCGRASGAAGDPSLANAVTVTLNRRCTAATPRVTASVQLSPGQTAQQVAVSLAASFFAQGDTGVTASGGRVLFANTCSSGPGVSYDVTFQVNDTGLAYAFSPPFAQSLFETLAQNAAAASGEYDPNIGALMPRGVAAPGLGDDVLFDLQPLNFAFPMGGLSPSYTHAQVGSNGVIFLTNGAPSGATTTGYSGSAATMISNLRGMATQPPRIAPYWRDLNMIATNNGGVHFNNSVPGKFTITWRNAVHFGQTSPVFSFQAQLFSDGSVNFVYDGVIQNTVVTPITGLSQGAAVPDPGAADLSQESLCESTSRIVYQTFPTASSLDLASTRVLFTPDAVGGYHRIPTAFQPAQTVSYGSGCYASFASFYELFTASAIDLANSSMSMVSVGGGSYVMVPGLTTYVTPSGSATILPLTDDSETTVTLTSPFPYNGGTTTTLNVCSNGFVSVGSNGTALTPSAALFLNAPATAWRCWHDYNPVAVGSGQVKFEEIGTTVYITWDGVFSFGTTNPETFQFQLDTATGNVHFVWGAIGGFGNGYLVGYSPAGSSADPGNRDISATLPSTFTVVANDIRPLALSSSPAPIVGAAVTWTLSNIPATSAISAHLLSFGAIPAPGIDLGFIGAPGCAQLITLPATTILVFGTPTANSTLLIPGAPSLAGLTLHSQGASLGTTANALGVLTSNAITTVLGFF